MASCPWHGTECRCDGTVDHHRGRFAKWMMIDGKCPAGCEALIPTYMVGMYRGQVSDAKWREYEEMMRQAKK